MNGSITTEHTVWCLECNGWHTFNSKTLHRTEAEAKKLGWKMSYGKWYCPYCVKVLYVRRIAERKATP